MTKGKNASDCFEIRGTNEDERGRGIQGEDGQQQNTLLSPASKLRSYSIKSSSETREGHLLQMWRLFTGAPCWPVGVTASVITLL